MTMRFGILQFVDRHLVAVACLWVFTLTCGAWAQQPTPGPDDATLAPGTGQASVDTVSVNFDQVDLRTFIKTMGDITGVNFVLNDKVAGTVTVLSPTQVAITQLYGILESVLEVQGFVLVPAGDVVKVVPRADAPRHNLPVRIGSDPRQIPTDDTLITQIMPLTYVDAAEVLGTVQSLLGPQNSVAAYPRTNALVMTDSSAKIHHVAEILARLDVAESQEQWEVVTLQHASPQVLAEQVLRIQEKVVALTGNRPSGSAAAAAGLRVVPDARTNTLVIIGKPKEVATTKDLVRQLDVPRPARSNDIHVVYLKNAQAKEVADSLKAALSGLRISGPTDGTKPVQVTADEGTNSLIIAAINPDFDVIQQIIDKLDIVREQVLVEMLIMEVSEESLVKIGVDWATMDQAVEGSARFFGATNLGPRVDFLGGDYQGLALGAWKKSGDGVSIGAILNALDKQSEVNILSTPQITTSNHRKARIIVGENRPFVKDSRITETSDPVNPTVIKTYEYKDVGITLDITPHVSQGGMVRMEIDSEFTKLITDVTSASADTPTTAKRQAQTTISMQSGATVVIGGLIRDDKVKVQKKVPFVGSLPLVGRAFRYEQDQTQKTNLLIFITPRVMTSSDDLNKISQAQRDQVQTLLAKDPPEPTDKELPRDPSD